MKTLRWVLRGLPFVWWAFVMDDAAYRAKLAIWADQDPRR